MRIGVDIGGVIIARTGNEDTSFFSDNFLSTPEESSAFASIRTLVLDNDGEVVLISKCGENVERKTRLWLEEREFVAFTGVFLWYFCRTRAEKAPIASFLDLDVFIDDRVDICSSMNDAGIRAIRFVDWPTTMKELGYA